MAPGTTSPQATCYHCGNPVPAGAPWRIVIDATAQPLCCPGCEAVAHAIVAGGLARYYAERTALPERPEDGRQHAKAWALFDAPERQARFVQRIDEGEHWRVTLEVANITCAACAWLIEHRLNAIDGVVASAVDLRHHRLRLDWNPTRTKLSTLLAALAGIGYAALPYTATRKPPRRALTHILRLNAPAVLSLGGAYLIAYLTRDPNAIIAAALFTALLLLGVGGDTLLRRRSGFYATSCKALPCTATQLLDDDSERVLPCDELERGMQIVLRPGQVVHADGYIERGESSLDVSRLTGEGLPVMGKAGEPILAGSRVMEAPLVMRVSATDKETQLAALDAAIAHARKAVHRRQRQHLGAPVVWLSMLATALGWWVIAPAHILASTLAVLIVGGVLLLPSSATSHAIAYAALRQRGLLFTRAAKATEKAHKGSLRAIVPPSRHALERFNGAFAMVQAARCARRRQQGFMIIFHAMALPLAAFGLMSPLTAVAGLALSTLVALTTTGRLAFRLSRPVTYQPGSSLWPQASVSSQETTL
ncbi:heavy metal translocating P-type ATPase metal-binding domain-containing protein [Halomonas dongshanensis]|uniref:Heavy metal translocating P-type ATPase metal-binding domain-containing protein n=1 Tax=Halomonas dongshanensis TaxID=2890835 RepID=A0ABT2EGT5_9GAMM|nr:heavy metal translocating P-type ATPase metal-binding domain-containing protein [Halomonas dongshanensis]MCS2609829.1 heavy metal translocating P-type ATPase metal-binding domain-containing protein [Halomonas dongshanensis]